MLSDKSRWNPLLKTGVVEKIMYKDLEQTSETMAISFILFGITVFNIWAFTPTSVAIPLTTGAWLLLSSHWRHLIWAHNRACGAELLRTRDIYASMACATGTSGDDLEERAAAAFAQVDNILLPVLGEGTGETMPLASARAALQNIAFVIGAAAAGFFLRPEAAALVVWLDRHGRQF